MKITNKHTETLTQKKISKLDVKMIQAIFFCFLKDGSLDKFKLARLLIQKGADVNYFNYNSILGSVVDRSNNGE